MVVKKLIVALTMTAMLASASGVAHVGSGTSDVRRFAPTFPGAAGALNPRPAP
jgi:hypothetical protein